MTPETKDYIDDQVRLSTDSTIKAQTQMLHYIQTSLNSLHGRFDSHNSNIQEEVKAVIKETVNGKIDRMSAKLDEHAMRVQPMLDVFEKNKVISMVVNEKGKLILKTAGGVVTLAAAYYILKDFIKTLI